MPAGWDMRASTEASSISGSIHANMLASMTTGPASERAMSHPIVRAGRSSGAERRTRSSVSRQSGTSAPAIRTPVPGTASRKTKPHPSGRAIVSGRRRPSASETSEIPLPLVPRAKLSKSPPPRARRRTA